MSTNYVFFFQWFGENFPFYKRLKMIYRFLYKNELFLGELWLLSMKIASLNKINEAMPI